MGGWDAMFNRTGWHHKRRFLALFRILYQAHLYYVQLVHCIITGQVCEKTRPCNLVWFRKSHLFRFAAPQCAIYIALATIADSEFSIIVCKWEECIG